MATLSVIRIYFLKVVTFESERTKLMVPAYTGIRSLHPEPVDLLFINLSNWAGRPVYPYAFVQVSALARRAGLSVVRWDGLGLNRQQQLECIAKLVRDHQPRAVAFTRLDKLIRLSQTTT